MERSWALPFLPPVVPAAVDLSSSSAVCRGGKTMQDLGSIAGSWDNALHQLPVLPPSSFPSPGVMCRGPDDKVCTAGKQATLCSCCSPFMLLSPSLPPCFPLPGLRCRGPHDKVCATLLAAVEAHHQPPPSLPPYFSRTFSPLMRVQGPTGPGLRSTAVEPHHQPPCSLPLTPLVPSPHSCVCRGPHDKVCAALLAAGSDPDLRCRSEGNTPLFVAILAGQKLAAAPANSKKALQGSWHRTVAILLAAGASWNPFGSGAGGGASGELCESSLLFYAVKSEDEELVALMMASGQTCR